MWTPQPLKNLTKTEFQNRWLVHFLTQDSLSILLYLLNPLVHKTLIQTIHIQLVSLITRWDLMLKKKKSTFYSEKKWIGRKSGKSKRMKTFSDLTHEMPPCFISFAMLWLRNVKFCVGKIKYDRNPILFWQIQNLTYLSLLNDSTLQLFSETWMWWAVPYQYYSAFFNLNIPEHFQWSKNQYNEMM